MIAICIALCFVPTLCLAACCPSLEPPQFPLRAPPRPPNLNDKLSCPAIAKYWPEYDSSKHVLIYTSESGGLLQIRLTDDVDFSNETDQDHIPSLPGEHVPSTSANPFVSGNKKSSSVGMVLGIVAGLLMLFLLILLVWICTRNKPIKGEANKGKDERTNVSFLHMCQMNSSNWKKSATSSKMLRHLFRNTEKSEGIDSVASSESGYCEDIVDNQESTSPRTPLKARKSQPQPSSSEMVSMTDATPDIIASAQITSLEEVPKRWSMFGLLPSLKPLLVSSASQSEMPDLNDSDDIPLRSNSVSGTGKNPDDAAVMSPNKKLPDRPPTNLSSSRPVAMKKSRIRIRSDDKQPEIDV